MKKYKVLTNLFKGFNIGDHVVKRNKHYCRTYMTVDEYPGKVPVLPQEFVENYPDHFEELTIKAHIPPYPILHDKKPLKGKKELHEKIVRKFKALCEYYYEDEKILMTIDSGYNRQDKEAFLYIGVKRYTHEPTE